MSTIREVYNPLPASEAQYSERITPRWDKSLETIHQLTERICDIFIPPNPYKGVLMLHRAADYASGRSFCCTFDDPQSIKDWQDATKFLSEKAEALDDELYQRMCAELDGAA